MKISLPHSSRHAPEISSGSPGAARPALETLLQRKDIWRGNTGTSTGAVITSGYQELDQYLAGGGWPLSGLIDLTQRDHGQGEWQLLAPALARLSHQTGLLVLINPPAMPFAPGLMQAGINYRALRVIQSRQRERLLAATVDVIKSQCCSAILIWERQNNWRYAELRKLQLAAGQHQCLCLCLRKVRPGRVQSPAHLRLHTELEAQGLQVRILKQRGQSGPKQCLLPRPDWHLPAHAELFADSNHMGSSSSHRPNSNQLQRLVQHHSAQVLPFPKATREVP